MSTPDLEHAMILLASNFGPLKCVAIVHSDSSCRFDAGLGPCRSPLRMTAIIMDEDGASAVSFCERHMKVMYDAIAAWRTRNNWNPLPPLEEMTGPRSAPADVDDGNRHTIVVPIGGEERAMTRDGAEDLILRIQAALDADTTR